MSSENDKQKSINHALNMSVNNDENASLVSFKCTFNLSMLINVSWVSVSV